MSSRNDSFLLDKESVSKFSGLIHQYFNRFLADDSLSDLDVLLLSIYLIDQKQKKSGAKYEDCKKLFISLGRKEDNFRKRVHLAKSKDLIEERGRLLFILINGLKKIRKSLGQLGKSPVYVIKSGENFSAIKLFEEFLTNEIKHNEVLLCDPYVSSPTLFPFSVLENKVDSIKILTSNIYDSIKFKGYKKKLEKETGINIEVKLNKKIHDRYIISGKKCWSIGSSIKNLGNKDTIIKNIDEVAESMRELFFERWK